MAIFHINFYNAFVFFIAIFCNTAYGRYVTSTSQKLPQLSCDFETKCKFLEYDKHSWNITAASWRPNRYSPSEDHTFPNTSKGHYVYFNGAHNIQLTTIMTPKLELVNASACLEFYYVINGPAVRFLNVSFVAGDDPYAIRKRWLSTANLNATMWHRGYLELPEQLYSIQIEATMINSSKSGQNGLIAVDDIKIFQCVKNSTSPTPSPVFLPKCDFESGNCDFVNDELNQFDWNLEEAKEANHDMEKRPKKDHTTGSENGHYMYIETVPTSKMYDGGRLLLPNFQVPDDNETYCLEFYFNSYLFPFRELRLYNFSDPDYVNTVWHAYSDTNPMWVWVVTPLSTGNARLAVSVHLEDVDAKNVGVAIDDVRVFKCPILHHPPQKTKSFLTRLDCDFDTSECGMMNGPKQTSVWTRVQPSNVTKPETDFKNDKNGYFLEVSPDEGATTWFGSVLSPQLEIFPDWCLDFYFYVNEGDPVVLINETDFEFKIGLERDHLTTWILSYNGDNITDKWQHAKNISLDPGIGARLSFTAFINTQKRPVYIAIDNIQIDSCQTMYSNMTTITPMTMTTNLLTSTVNTTDVTVVTNATSEITTTHKSTMTTSHNTMTTNTVTMSTDISTVTTPHSSDASRGFVSGLFGIVPLVMAVII